MICTREVPEQVLKSLQREGVDPLLARIYAARGVSSVSAISAGMEGLVPPDSLKGINSAARLLADAISKQQRICIIADYDCDGATACAVAIRGLRMFGAVVDYLVPNRREHGYGLTPAIVALAGSHPRLGRPDLLVTVDNGIASHEGVAKARAAGMKVLVTDHHLPAATLPEADAIVNPNQPGCAFPSKSIAGVGVMFYVLAALRSHYRSVEPDSERGRTPLASLLDLVALGTVADVVRLDENNRRLVNAGLKRLRAGNACAGIRALMLQSGRDCTRASATDFGFAVGPRINAAGRLADISLGVAALLTDDETEAARLAVALDSINRERRSIEKDMVEQALDVARLPSDQSTCIVAWHDSWHEGVVGLVASQLKTRFNRPAFAFAPGAQGSQWKGSGRSITGIHLRDALDMVVKREPDLIVRFGGHAMAAGLTLEGIDLERFSRAIESVLEETTDPACFRQDLLTDGALDPADLSASLVHTLESEVWGQGFPEPLFHHRFRVVSQKIVGERHLKLELASGSKRYSAIAFGREEPIPAEAVLVYRPSFNEYRGQRTLQLVVSDVVSAASV